MQPVERREHTGIFAIIMGFFTQRGRVDQFQQVENSSLDRSPLEGRYTTLCHRGNPGIPEHPRWVSLDPQNCNRIVCIGTYISGCASQIDSPRIDYLH